MPAETSHNRSATNEGISFAEAFDLINPHLYTVEERIRAQAKAFDPAVEGYIS
jgi:octaprenyl-diphosphate synthase